jgi:hypothetical protein
VLLVPHCPEKSSEVWESALHEMEVILNFQVQKVFATSYDSLVDDYQKNLFLDIACFFNGTDYNYAVSVVVTHFWVPTNKKKYNNNNNNNNNNNKRI